MAVFLSPIGNGAQYFTTGGLPLNGGFLNTYQAGTTTPQETFTTSAGNISNGVSIQLGTDGRPPAEIWLTDNVAYKFILTDSLGAPVGPPMDNISGIGSGVSTGFAASSGSSLIGWIQSGVGAVLRLVQDKLRERVSVKDFGAVGGGVTDDYAAFVLALASGAKYIIADGIYRLSAGITIPNGVTLDGLYMLPGNPYGGSQLIFDASVATCVTLTEGSNQTGSLKNIVVARTGTAPAGSTGVLVDRAYASVIENVLSYNHARNWSFYAQTTSGISTIVRGMFSGRASEDHVYIDSWPELRVIGGRLGTNGTGDLAANTFIRITGTSAISVGVGPNTITFQNVQFNQGAAGPAYFVHFDTVATGVGNQAFYSIADCFVENVTSGYFRATGALTIPGRVSITNSSFNTVVPFFSWVSTAAINEMRIDGCYIAASTFAPTPNTCNGLSVTGNSFGGCAVTYNAPAGDSWNVASVGNTFAASSSQTISGSGWTSGFFADTFNNGCTLTNTATPRKNVTVISPGNSLTTWTPVLNFGGATTGITYTTQSAACHVVGNQVTYQFKIVLSSKGSATGSATITGFPIVQNTASYQTGGGGVCTSNSGMATLTGPILLNGVVAAVPGRIEMNQQGAGGVASLTDVNFTNTSNFSGTLAFFL